MGVRDVAGDTVRRLSQHLIDPAGLHQCQHRVEPRALVRVDASSAGARGILERGHDGPAFLLRALAAQRYLIRCRHGLLVIADETCVNARAHWIFPSAYAAWRSEG